jgi:hypothetical protein
MCNLSSRDSPKLWLVLGSTRNRILDRGSGAMGFNAVNNLPNQKTAIEQSCVSSLVYDPQRHRAAL